MGQPGGCLGVPWRGWGSHEGFRARGRGWFWEKFGGPGGGLAVTWVVCGSRGDLGVPRGRVSGVSGGLTGLRGLLADVLVLDGADAAAEHDGLDPLAPLPPRQHLPEGAGEPWGHPRRHPGVTPSVTPTQPRGPQCHGGLWVSPRESPHVPDVPTAMGVFGCHPEGPQTSPRSPWQRGPHEGPQGFSKPRRSLGVTQRSTSDLGVPKAVGCPQAFPRPQRSWNILEASPNVPKGPQVSQGVPKTMEISECHGKVLRVLGVPKGAQDHGGL